MTANFKKIFGFTLIEVLIVIVIIGILSAAAFPSYVAQVITSRRTEAQRKLISHAQTMERYFTSRGRYTLTATAGTSACGPQETAENGFYHYATVCGSDTTFNITATPIGSASQATDGTLSLDNTGARTSSLRGKWASLD